MSSSVAPFLQAQKQHGEPLLQGDRGMSSRKLSELSSGFPREICAAGSGMLATEVMIRTLSRFSNVGVFPDRQAWWIYSPSLWTGPPAAILVTLKKSTI